MARPRPVPPYVRWCCRRLLERLESDLLLFRRDADSGVGDGERDPLAAPREHAVLQIGGVGRADGQVHAAVRVNLKAFDKRFLRICCRRLASVWMARGRSARDGRRTRGFGLGQVVERPLHEAVQVSEPHLPTSTTTVPDSILAGRGCR